MDQKESKTVHKPPQITIVLRMIAGAYLVYLAYGLFKEYLNPQSGGLFYQIGAAVFFFAVGAIMLTWGALKLKKGEYIKFGETSGDEMESSDEPQKK